MRIFFGAAIQGLTQRGERSLLYAGIMESIKSLGHTLVSEHTATGSREETARAMEESIGPLPPAGLQRNSYVRNRMIEAIESDIGAAIFEVSTPSLGTGIEIAHAYLRPRMGLKAVPILNLYQTGFWPNQLSTMIRGITPSVVPELAIVEFTDIPSAQSEIRKWLGAL